MNDQEKPTHAFHSYSQRLQKILAANDWCGVERLGLDLQACWQRGSQVFLCGNGGSAANAIHLANDFLYGVGGHSHPGMRVHALTANPAVITCLANDINYEQIFAEQLAVLGKAGDILIAFSGSGTSANIQAVLREAKKMKIKSYAVLGFSGGACKALADVPIHFAVDDMQISEDLQMIVGHMLMQWLYRNPPQLETNDEAIHVEPLLATIPVL